MHFIKPMNKLRNIEHSGNVSAINFGQIKALDKIGILFIFPKDLKFIIKDK